MACGSGVASGGVLRPAASASTGSQLSISSSTIPSPGSSTSNVPSLSKPSTEPAQAAEACSTGTRACPIRIVFAAGAYSAQARGKLTGISSEQWFVVKARAGQAMVAVVEGAGATRGIVGFPNGQSDGQPGGRVFDGVLPVSGDYQIRVTESSMGEGWSGRVDVVVLIY
jgi:hypothetical protein